MKFLKDDIKVSKDGLIKMMDGNNNPVVQPLTRDDIEVFKLMVSSQRYPFKRSKIIIF